jgi:hypothetical protein
MSSYFVPFLFCAGRFFDGYDSVRGNIPQLLDDPGGPMNLNQAGGCVCAKSEMNRPGAG